jgi:putative membrane protein
VVRQYEPSKREDKKMRQFIIKLIINAAALFAVVRLVPGIGIDDTGTLVLSSLVLGFLNAVLRPVIAFFSLPVTVLTLGLFTLVVNGVVFALAAWVVPGFNVSGFGSAVLGALAFSIVSFLLNLLLLPSSERR